MAVTGEVARHDGFGRHPHRVGDLGLEGAVAVAKQHRYGTLICGVRAEVGDGQVEVAVAGEVPRHDARPGSIPTA